MSLSSLESIKEGDIIKKEKRDSNAIFIYGCGDRIDWEENMKLGVEVAVIHYLCDAIQSSFFHSLCFERINHGQIFNSLGFQNLRNLKI